MDHALGVIRAAEERDVVAVVFLGVVLDGSDDARIVEQLFQESLVRRCVLFADGVVVIAGRHQTAQALVMRWRGFLSSFFTAGSS